MKPFKPGTKIRLLKWGYEASSQMCLEWEQILEGGGPDGVVMGHDDSGGLWYDIHLPKDPSPEHWAILAKFVKRVR